MHSHVLSEIVVPAEILATARALVRLVMSVDAPDVSLQVLASREALAAVSHLAHVHPRVLAHAALNSLRSGDVSASALLS